MAEKRPSVDNDDSGIPRKRKAISLALKKQIINLYESGYGPSFIARDLNFSISTISSILKDKDRIKEHLKGTVSLDSAMITKRRSVAICEMEKQLMEWIEQEAKLGNPQTQSSIQSKAYSIYDEIYAKFGDENKNFAASPGWFRRFKARTKCTTVDETINPKTGKPVDVVEKFWKKIFKDSEYNNKTIFKLIEGEFYWKKLPAGTCHINDDKQLFTSNSDGEVASMLLCGNVDGSYKHKPLLIFQTKKDELADLTENDVPIYYRHSENEEITKELFEDWFKNCFTPEVEKYCKDNDIPYKILLVLNQSKWYTDVEKFNVFNPYVKLVVLPNENIADQRSFDRFVTLYFKSYYLQCIFVQAIEESENNDNFDFRNFWANYDIIQAMYNIDKVWNEMNLGFLSAMCTFDVVQLVFTSETEKSEKISEILDEIAKLAYELNIKVIREGVVDLIDGVKQKKSKIIVVLNGVNQIVNVTKVGDNSLPVNESNLKSIGFNSKELTMAFYEISSAMRRLQRMENDQERFAKVKQQVQEALLCYRKMLVFKKES